MDGKWLGIIAIILCSTILLMPPLYAIRVGRRV
jgi:hypothetical protein